MDDAFEKGYWCCNCERKFDEPVVKTTTQARLFGVAEMPNDNRLTVRLCPFCKSEEIEETNDEEI